LSANNKRSLSSRALSLVETRLRTARLGSVRNVPWILRIHQGVPAAGEFFRLACQVLLERVQEEFSLSEPDEQSACRLLVDIIQLGGAPTVGLAVLRETLLATVMPSISWNHASLIGLDYASSGGFSSAFLPIFAGRAADSAYLSEWLRSASPIEAFLAAVGMSASHDLDRGSLPPRLFQHAAPLPSKRRTRLGRKLAKLYSIWEHERSVLDVPKDWLTVSRFEMLSEEVQLPQKRISGDAQHSVRRLNTDTASADETLL
jgi:hypothetical protein